MNEEQKARLASIEAHMAVMRQARAALPHIEWSGSVNNSEWLLALVKELDEDRVHVQQAGINAEAGRARAEQQLAAVTAELQRMREKYEAHG